MPRSMVTGVACRKVLDEKLRGPKDRGNTYMDIATSESLGAL